MKKKQLTTTEENIWDGKVHTGFAKSSPFSGSQVIWRKSTEELPKFNDTETSIECLIVVQYIDDNKLLTHVTSSYYEKTEHGNHWSNVMSSEIVIYWCYMSDISLRCLSC